MESSKHFLKGLSAIPPPDHIWQEHSGYSIYAAEMERATWERHNHNCTQITVALDPAYVKAEWQAEAGRYGTRELDGDMVWIVPPGVQHSIYWNKRTKLVHLYLDDSFFAHATESAISYAADSLAPSLLVRDPFLVEMAKVLARELSFGVTSSLFLGSMATVTATHLVRQYSNKPNALPGYRGGLGPMRERKVRQYIEAHLDAELSLDDLAGVAEISPNYFVSLFRQSTGMTPHQFVLRQRVEHALRLLANSKLTLTEIAHRCGFQDQSQFTTTFRRSMGVTPGRYRRSL